MEEVSLRTAAKLREFAKKVKGKVGDSSAVLFYLIFLKNSLILFFSKYGSKMGFIRDITLGQYHAGHSLLHVLDPRTKLLASLILMVCLLFAERPGSIVLHGTFCLLVWRLSGLPGRLVFGNLKPFLWIVSVTALVHIFTAEGRVLLIVPVFDWSISDQGLANALVYSARLLFLVLFAAFLTLTTPPTELTDGLEKMMSPLKKLRLPVHELALMMTLSLRFIPILIREAERVKNAQLSRGVSLEGPFLQRVRALLPMILPLFVLAMQRSEELAVAMESRAYSGGQGRTSYRELTMTQNDAAAIGLVSLVFVFTVAMG